MTRVTRRAALGALAAAPLARPALIRAQTVSAPVKIGLLSDVGGPYRHVGGPGSRVTAEMAVADFGGSVLGRPIQVLQGDDQNKADVAGALARQWIDDNGVDVLADGAATTAALAIQQIAREKKRVFLMSTPTATTLIGKQCSPYGFQFAADTYALGKAVGGALSKAGGNTWFFITADYEFGASLQANTEAFVKAAGGKVLGSVRAARHVRHPHLSRAGQGVGREGGRPGQRRHRLAELHQAGRRVRHHPRRPAARHLADDRERRDFSGPGSLPGAGAEQFLLLGSHARDARLDRALHGKDGGAAE
jgi:hypothetical protein